MKPTIRALGTVGLLLAVTACVDLAPRHATPPLPVANAWPADTGAETARALADLNWSHYFQDAEMRRLIGLALEHNRDLRLAVLRVREAEAAYRIQRSELPPSIGVQGQGTRARDIAAPLPDQTVVQSKYQAAVGLTNWEIDFWGRIRNLKDAALDEWLATDAARHALALLVGADPGPRSAVPVSLDATPLASLRPGLPADVLLARPDIRAAEYRLRAAHARIGAARAAFLPRISLTSSLGTASTELDGLFESGSRAWMFTPVIEIPIFTAGRLQANPRRSSFPDCSIRSVPWRDRAGWSA